MYIYKVMRKRDVHTIFAFSDCLIFSNLNCIGHSRNSASLAAN